MTAQGVNRDRSGTPWLAWEDKLLRQHYANSLTADIAAALRRRTCAVYARAKHLGVSKDPAFTRERARVTSLARSPFTPEIAEFLQLLYPDTFTEELAMAVGIPRDRIHAYATKRGWKKDPQWVRDAARRRTGPDHPMRAHQFRKGQVPANKGVKGWQAGGRSVETQFKKGARPYTWKPIGSYRVNADGYLDQKVTDTGYPPDDWRPVHRLVWEAAHGPIPDDHVVRFRDGMKTTDPELLTVDRLECISRKENARRNAWHANYPPELKKLLGTRIALTRTINRRQRELEQTT